MTLPAPFPSTADPEFGPTPHGPRPGRACLAIVAACTALLATPALAATYAVGIGTACTHTTIQAAINAAVANPSGPHLIRLTTGTWSIPNGLVLHEPQADITIEGGYASCGAATPTAGQGSTIDATGGNDGGVLDLRRAAPAGPASPTVRLSRLTLTGGTAEAGIGANPEGGGLRIRGHLAVQLTNGSRVTGNRSAWGGGVFIEGPASISLRDDSEVSANIATIDGGGIHCVGFGLVGMAGGRLVGNQAGRDGGGIHADACVVFLDGLAGAVNRLVDNVAGTVFAGAGQGRGGAIHLVGQGALPTWNLLSIGTGMESTTLFIGNEARGVAGASGTAGFGGGAIYVEGAGTERVVVQIDNAVFANNLATSSGAGISVARAVDLRVSGRAARCSGAFGFGLCSAFSGHNRAAISIDDLGVADPALTPHALVERTRFTANQSASQGVIHAWRNAPGSRVTIRHSVFDQNQTAHVLALRSTAALVYSTVVDNGFGGPDLIRVTPNAGQAFALDLTGSILWQPGTTVVGNAGAGSVAITHRDCLLAHSTLGLPSPAAIQTAAPALEADWTPSTASPAIDVCHVLGGAPAFDAYGQSRPVDQPWRPNLLGAYDLGAIERPLGPGPVDAIFQNGFE
jgi:hypothetical protein